MTFGEAVKKTMLERGMTAKALSDASGVNEAYISRILSGNIKDPAFVKAVAIMKALGVDIDSFVDSIGGN